MDIHRHLEGSPRPCWQIKITKPLGPFAPLKGFPLVRHIPPLRIPLANRAIRTTWSFGSLPVFKRNRLSRREPRITARWGRRARSTYILTESEERCVFLKDGL